MSSEEKQEYLRVHIIQKGREPELFISYLEQQKEDGADIDNWTLEELKAIVEQYTESLDNGEEMTRRETSNKEKLQVFGQTGSDRDSCSSEDEGQQPTNPGGYKGLSSSDEDGDDEEKDGESTSSEDEDEDEDEEAEEKKEEKEEKEDDDEDDESSSSDDDEDEDEEEKMQEKEKPKKIEIMDEAEEDALVEEGGINAEEPEKSSGNKSSKYYSKRKVSTYVRTQLVTDQKITIEVSHPEIVKAKQFFKSTYTIYNIKVTPFEWTVKRRYSDFEWLYNCLVKRFPANYVSPNLTQRSLASPKRP